MPRGRLERPSPRSAPKPARAAETVPKPARAADTTTQLARDTTRPRGLKSSKEGCAGRQRLAARPALTYRRDRPAGVPNTRAPVSAIRFRAVVELMSGLGEPRRSSRQPAHRISLIGGLPARSDSMATAARRATPRCSRTPVFAPPLRHASRTTEWNARPRQSGHGRGHGDISGRGSARAQVLALKCSSLFAVGAPCAIDLPRPRAWARDRASRALFTRWRPR